jgi:hypothetical protein
MVGKHIQTNAFERARGDPITVVLLDAFAGALRQSTPERSVGQ